MKKKLLTFVFDCDETVVGVGFLEDQCVGCYFVEMDGVDEKVKKKLFPLE